MPLVEPDDNTPPADSLPALLGAGVPEADALVIARALDPLVAANPARVHEDVREAVVAQLYTQIGDVFQRYASNRSAAHLQSLGLAVRAMVRAGAVRPARDEYDQRLHGRFRYPVEPISRMHYVASVRAPFRALRALAPAWIGGLRGLVLAEGLTELRGDHVREGLPDLLLARAFRWLVRRGYLDPTRVIDKDAVASVSLNFSNRDLERPTRLELWLDMLGPEALTTFLPVLTREPEEVVGRLAAGVLRGFQNWTTQLRSSRLGFDRKGGGPDDDALLGRACARAFAPMLAHVQDRLCVGEGDIPASHVEDHDLLGAYWSLVLRVDRLAPELLPPRAREVARKTADRALGRLRPFLRDTGAAENAPAFRGFWGPCIEAARVLVRFEGLWPALKAILLAFQAMSMPAVARDLRYWGEAHRDPQPPEPWMNVPMLFAGFVHGYARDEEKKDPELLALRSEFATFCLERLKSKDRSDTPVEARPDWRVCYVRAFQDLRVNPRGTGHHVLHRASKHDPDPHVRAAAKIAYEETRHGVVLPPGSSPRRAIMSGFWWLRQAHLLALGIDPDPQGAQRTRQKETRRTKEEEPQPIDE